MTASIAATGAVQWWCAAQGTSWTWTPRAYVGVWLIILAIGVTYWRLMRHLRPGVRVAGWFAILGLWMALDWPLGPLGAGYLLLAHSVQFLMVTMIVAPLLLLSLRHRLNGPNPPRAFTGSVVRTLTKPLTAAIIFNLVAIMTHAPLVVDNLMSSQLGAFAIDLSWLLGGLIFWWPTMIRIPGHAYLRMPVTLLYLFLGTLFHTGIAIAMLAAQLPLYRIYELAPPLPGMNPLDDQQLSGTLMEAGGLCIILAIATVLFFRWANSVQESQ